MALRSPSSAATNRSSPHHSSTRLQSTAELPALRGQPAVRPVGDPTAGQGDLRNLEVPLLLGDPGEESGGKRLGHVVGAAMDQDLGTAHRYPAFALVLARLAEGDFSSPLTAVSYTRSSSSRRSSSLIKSVTSRRFNATNRSGWPGTV